MAEASLNASDCGHPGWFNIMVARLDEYNAYAALRSNTKGVRHSAAIAFDLQPGYSTKY